MTFVTIPDTEAMIVKALLSIPVVQNSALDGRIYTVVPKNEADRVFPMARVSRFGGEPLWGGDPYWADAPALQVDVWAKGGMVEAHDLAELLRACCAQLLPGTWPQGIICSARVSSLIQGADTTFDPPKPRYRFTTTMIVHPSR